MPVEPFHREHRAERIAETGLRGPRPAHQVRQRAEGEQDAGHRPAIEFEEHAPGRDDPEQQGDADRVEAGPRGPAQGLALAGGPAEEIEGGEGAGGSPQ
ncbi:MAG: hypothetical protein IPI38_16790 [Gemmatimonadetes bacterium]|nr:hypothetical protein [Gemmatimonadota bacterium]